MATIENNGLMIYLDSAGNKNILYPITKTELVDGLEEALTEAKNHTHTPEEIGAAPDGYGLGGVSTRTADCNTIRANGWYYGDSSTANRPCNYFTLLHLYRTTSGMSQIAYSVSSNDMYWRYCDGGTWSNWTSINNSFAAASHGNHLYFQDNTFTTSGTNVTTITAPGTIIAVFINFHGQSSEWNHDIVYVPTSNRHAPFYCYDMINSSCENWPMQLYWYSASSIGVGRYSGNTAQLTCYCRTLYVQN